MLHRSVIDIMDKSPSFWRVISAEETLQTAVDLLCADADPFAEGSKITAIVVCDGDGKFQAIVTGKDLLRAIHGRGMAPQTTPLEAIVGERGDTLAAGDSILDALELMSLRGADYLTLVDADARPLGVLSRRQMLTTVKAHVDGETRAAQTRLFGAHVFPSAPD